MDKLVAIRIRHNDGTYSDDILLSVLANNIDWDGTHSLIDILGNVDLSKGSIQEQINALITKVTTDTVEWDLTHTLTDVLGDVDLDKGDLQTQINNISSGEVYVDTTLSTQGKAADAKAVGDNLKNVVRVGNSNVTNFTSIILGDTAEQVNLLDQSDLIDINARLSALEGGDIQTDQTLSVQGMAADAKATGDAIHNLQGLVGTPLVAATAASMTNTDKIYVYTGSETGYTNGNWYYYDGTAWVSGGVYNSVAMNMDTVPTLGSSNPVTSGGIKTALDAADAEIGELKENFTNLDNSYFAKETLTSSDDLNSITNTGNYAWNTGSAPANWPVGHIGSARYGTLTVVNGASGIFTQLIVTYSNEVFVRRKGYGGTGWTNWTELSAYADIISLQGDVDSLAETVTIQVLSSTDDVNSLAENGYYIFNAGSAPTNWPNSRYGVLINQGSGFSVQMVIDYDCSVYTRRRTWGGAWSAWMEFDKSSPTVLSSTSDLNQLYTGTFAYNSTSAGVPQNWPNSSYGVLKAQGNSDFCSQIMVDWNGAVYVRRKGFGTTAAAWSTWLQLADKRDVTNPEPISMTSGYCIFLSGATADPSAPTASTAGFRYAVVNCVEGDLFTISAKGGSSPRAYGFLDASNNVIERAPAGVTYTDKVVKAPHNAAKLVINTMNSATSYVGITTDKRFEYEKTEYTDLYKVFQKVGVIGDSLSVGYSWNISTSTAVSRVLAVSWAKQISRDIGVPWLNLGTSGQNVLTWCSNDTYGKVQLEASGNKSQAYIIGLGENDCSDSTRGVPLGAASDIVDNPDTVATTYYGGYARIIQLIKRLNSDAKIFCLTNPLADDFSHSRSTYNAAVRYIATEYYDTTDNVYLVDLAEYNDLYTFPNYGIGKDKEKISSHYSPVGYVMVADIMKRVLNKTIMDHQTDFWNCAFISYDTGTPTADTMTD